MEEKLVTLVKEEEMVTLVVEEELVTLVAQEELVTLVVEEELVTLVVEEELAVVVVHLGTDDVYLDHVTEWRVHLLLPLLPPADRGALWRAARLLDDGVPETLLVAAFRREVKQRDVDPLTRLQFYPPGARDRATVVWRHAARDVGAFHSHVRVV